MDELDKNMDNFLKTIYHTYQDYGEVFNVDDVMGQLEVLKNIIKFDEDGNDDSQSNSTDEKLAEVDPDAGDLDVEELEGEEEKEPTLAPPAAEETELLREMEKDQKAAEEKESIKQDNSKKRLEERRKEAAAKQQQSQAAAPTSGPTPTPLAAAAAAAEPGKGQPKSAALEKAAPAGDPEAGPTPTPLAAAPAAEEKAPSAAPASSATNPSPPSSGIQSRPQTPETEAAVKIQAVQRGRKGRKEAAAALNAARGDGDVLAAPPPPPRINQRSPLDKQFLRRSREQRPPPPPGGPDRTSSSSDNTSQNMQNFEDFVKIFGEPSPPPGNPPSRGSGRDRPQSKVPALRRLPKPPSSNVLSGPQKNKVKALEEEQKEEKAKIRIELDALGYDKNMIGDTPPKINAQSRELLIHTLKTEWDNLKKAVNEPLPLERHFVMEDGVMTEEKIYKNLDNGNLLEALIRNANALIKYGDDGQKDEIKKAFTQYTKGNIEWLAPALDKDTVRKKLEFYY